MSTTRSNFSLALVLAFGTIACAEPAGITVPGTGKKNTGVAGSTSQSGTKATSSSGGGTAKTTSPSSGGAQKTTAGSTSDEGGSSGADTSASEAGGTENTSTDTTGSGGTVTTTSTPTAASCEGSLDEVTVTATTTTNGASGSTTIKPASGASIAVADIGVKFCFTISSNLTEKSLVIDSAAISTTSAPYVDLKAMKVTLEDGSDGASCLLFDVAGVSTAASLTLDSAGKLSIDWRFDYNAVGNSKPDPSKPAQFIVTHGSDIAGCGDVPLS